MKGVAMYYTVKTMLDQGKSIAGIARDLDIDRKTVRKGSPDISVKQIRRNY